MDIAQPIATLRFTGEASNEAPAMVLINGRPANAYSVLEIKQAAFAIYPNPTANVVNVRFTGTVTASAVAWQVIDLAGKTLAKGTFGSSQVENTLDLTSLPSGTYSLRLGDETYKIVKH